MKQAPNILLTPKVLVLADQFLFSGGNFVGTLLMARLFSTKEFGIYSAIVLHSYLLISLGNAICIQPLQVAPVKQQQSAAYAGFIFYLQLAFAAASIAVSAGAACLGGLSHFISIHTLVITAGILMHDFARKYLLSKQRLRFVLALDFTVIVPQLLILLSYYNLQGIVSETLLWFGLAYLPAILVFALWLKPSTRHFKLWPALFLRQMRKASWYGLVACIQWGAANLFVVSAGVFISVEALGAFRLIQSLFGILNVLFQGFENYVLPAASRLYQQSAEASKHYIIRTGRRSLLVIGILLVLLFVFAKPVLSIASGQRYAEYAYVLRGMCLLYLVLFISYPIRLSIRVLLLSRDFFTGYLLSFLFSLACFNLFISQWMLGGVVAGLITSQLIMLSFWLYRLHQKKFHLWK